MDKNPRASKEAPKIARKPELGAGEKFNRFRKDNPGLFVFAIGVFVVLLALVQSSMSHKTAMSSQDPKVRSQIIPDDSKSDLTGVNVNNQRIEAELQRQHEMLNLPKNPTSVKPSDPLSQGVGLSQEHLNTTGIHDHSQAEQNYYPDVKVRKELEADNQEAAEDAARAAAQKKYIIEDLKRQAEAQHVDLQYDEKTGEITVDRLPQSQAPGK